MRHVWRRDSRQLPVTVLRRPVVIVADLDACTAAGAASEAIEHKIDNRIR